MTISLEYWIESTTGKTWFKVPELLPFETRMFAVNKTTGYAPNIDAAMIFGDEFMDHLHSLRRCQGNVQVCPLREKRRQLAQNK